MSKLRSISAYWLPLLFNILPLLANDSITREDFFQDRKQYNLVSGLPDIYISAKTEGIGCTWKEGNVYDKPLIESAYSILKNKNDPFVFLDVGAQTGCFTLLAKYFPASKWYAFEPIKEATDELNINLLLNDIKNVSVYQICISDHAGLGHLRIPKDDDHWGLATFGEKLFRFQQYEEKSVQCITLDEFVEENSIKKVDFIKIDTEGWELFVLRGGRTLINRDRPIILMEFNQSNMDQCDVDGNDVFQFLEETGYEWSLITPEDILCIPRNLSH
jgi:FkbM family methyltransferase